MTVAKVYLIGAGPGDPELITVKGRRILEHADAILYDHLAPDALLDLAPARAERVYVGKKKSVHAFSQEEICGMMIDRARRGLTVARLKGGDPLLFGRGGEEAEALAEAGVPFEIVPGVTTPLGIAAYSGVPLTHREHTSAVTFVTGHAVDAIDWNKLGQAETLVIFMGLTAFAEIARALIASGRAPDTPAMAVRWATRPDQETVTGTLETLPGLIAARGMKPPTTIVVGEVVTLREKLNWYRKPAAVRQTHRCDACPRAGRRPGSAAGSIGRTCDRAAYYRNPARRRSGAARPRHRESGCLRLADLHQRHRRALLRRAAGWLRV